MSEQETDATDAPAPPAPRHRAPRSVLVTGANRGIGRGDRRAVRRLGDRVATIYRSGDLPDGVLGVGRATCRDTASVDAAFAEIEAAHGPVEVLVANAGVTRDGLLMRMTDEEFESVLDVNLTGVVPVRAPRRQGHDPAAPRPDRAHLLRRRPVRLARPGQLRLVEVRAGRHGALGHPRARRPRHHRERRRPRLHRHRDDRRAAAGPAGRLPRVDPGRPVRPRRTRSPASCTSSPRDDAAYITGAVVPVDGGLGMGH